ncbi:MAG: hypothetical protein PHI42_04240 [Paludibacteraceae bacterium]|nr:hypothetical protein [Paludibacteraceae bacterium]
MKKFLLISVLLINIYGCSIDPKMKPVLYIHNFTDEAVYIYHSKYDSIQLLPKLYLFEKSHSRDIDKFGNDLDTIISPEYRVNAHNETFFVGYSKWQPFDDVDYVYFFFIKEEIMKNCTWEQIVEKQLYERKVKYTYAELEKANYQIFYR